MNIKNYVYNGFFVNLLPGMAPYTGEFVEWTRDPGVARVMCSDETVRKIPTCCIEDFKVADYPKQTYEHGKIIFGEPSRSQINGG